MYLRLFQKKIKISLFSLGIFCFFLFVSLLSLHIVREKILENSHIMGQEISARFAIKETARLKTQETLLRSAAQNMGNLLKIRPDISDEEIEHALKRFTEYMETTAEVERFEICAVVNGRLIDCQGSSKADLESLKWYQAALRNKNNVAYTNLYHNGKSNERLLTMAVALGEGNVMAMNLYPERLNSLLVDNQLPEHSYYYLCDPNGTIMFTINDRNMSIEAQQPYVEQIFREIRKGISENVPYIVDYDGNKRGVYYTVSDKGWISVVTIPYEYLLGDYESLMQWFILILIIFLFLTGCLALRENALNKQVESINEVVRVMSKSFLAVFRVNFVTDRYYLVKSETFGVALSEEGSYDELLQQVLRFVEPEAADEFAETFSRNNIQELVKRHIYDFGGEFRQRFGNEYKWMNVRLVRDTLLKDDEAIFFFREVDAEKQKELEHMQVTEHALRVARENAKSRNMFFSAMSHDMRAPLNGIIGMARLAELHNDDCNQVKEYIRKIKSSGQQLLTLINDILEMARLDNGKVEHVQETFVIKQVLQDTADIFAAQADLEQRFFDTQLLLDDNETVSGDLQGLQQILNNVLSNAIKYTKAQGKISFLVRRELGGERNRVYYTFLVRDNGCGMSEKFLEKIYKPFERDSRFGVPKVTGTGLGMTIVKSLVERMEGTIYISSRVDEGTCVMISLPFNIVKSAGDKQSVLPQLKDFAGCRVLVAEDNDVNMEIITELLTINGIEILPAANGEEAVNIFASSDEGSISMILMDMQMPAMDGCEATRRIRSMERTDAQTIPILALTGNSGSDDLEVAMAAGMNDYMIKPLQMKLLAKMMGEYLSH